MIYTCTMNAAIDLYVELDTLQPEIVNRTIDEDYQPNGKGVNVSIMLKKHGIDNVAMGFVAGFTGNFIQQSLNDLNIKTDFVHVDGITRINVFMNADKEYKVVNQGPSITDEKQQLLLSKIKQINKGDTLIVSGSLPLNVSDTIFIEIAKICEEKEIDFVLDTSIASPEQILKHKPYLLKPNDEELAAFFNLEHELDENEIIHYGQELIKQGAKQVLVSRGEKGSIFLNEDTCFVLTSPQGSVLNTACSGDALLGTFIGLYKQGKSLEEALIHATATGASTAFSKGLSDLTDIPQLVKQVQITRRGLNE
ncbi:1-phosphofructokinase [Alkalihalobacillus xiaoxiensis]|uniref:Tagatose-6-phosphate kinase n=1 Tax=Shouchella xiaoxiensis TaxID=766895 RepID=A0ABS2SWL5_9BACI|nr:1-phosphofructokinase [Shouchella xiaoxiensis]MBM7839566.1 1-phosphofructokinase [Shouchella xiaoxiensis]